MPHQYGFHSGHSEQVVAFTNSTFLGQSSRGLIDLFQIVPFTPDR